MSLIKLLILALVSVTCLIGCASTDPQPSGDRQVSSIPWNRPQKWEGGGQMGGMMGQ
jgi:hypothetical protein